MKPSGMSRKVEILLHIAVWLVLFLTPLSFMNHGNGVSLLQYLMLSVSPLVVMAVFYANYLWLTPHLLVRGERKYFFLINAVMCIGLGVALHCWMSFVFNQFEKMPPPPHPNMLHQLGFILRNVFNLLVAAGIATTVQLAMRWQKSEEARTEAELRNLRNQISPHFLLNTLNNIYALTAFDQQKAQEAIQQLSKMLRHMLYDNQEAQVAWADEVQFIENYVNLMKLRLPQSVEVTLNSQLNTFGSPVVAPLLFISLVENAFKHGISPLGPSFIKINLQADNGQIVCDIENSNYPKTSADRSGHGIGLSQVQRRLDLAYPGKYTWQKGVSPDGTTYRSRISITYH